MGEQRFDRAAAERILQRAIQLDATDDPAGAALGLSEEALREAAEELGVPAALVRRAAAEERLGALVPAVRRLDRLVGPGQVAADRLVEIPAGALSDRADAWLRAAGYRRRRAEAGAVEYLRRTDPAAAAQRAVRSVTGRPGLGSLSRIRVGVEPVDRTSSIVALVADLETQRTGALLGGGALAAGGTVAATATELATAGMHWAWFGVPAGAVAGWGVLRVRAWSLRGVEADLDAALEHLTASTGADAEPATLTSLKARLVDQVVEVAGRARASRRATSAG